MADFAAPVAMPNNYGGTFAAVEHLIGHGHTRIGFVGNLAQQDVRERSAAYAQALATYDLPVDPTLVYGVSDKAEAGGVAAARALLASPHRPTALMVATDRHAIGLMRTLAEAGVSIPADLAIVAFDNFEARVFSTPSLSSVNQRFDEIGALAGRLVLAAIHGEDVPSTVFTSPSVVVAVRESRGCVADFPELSEGRENWLLETSPELLRDELQDVLCGALLTAAGMVDGSMRDAVVATVRDAERLLQPGATVTTAAIGELSAACDGSAHAPTTCAGSRMR